MCYQVLYLLLRQRPGEQKTLHHIAAGGFQEIALLYGFDTLGGNAQPHGMAKRQHCRDDGDGIDIMAQVLDEAAVDLDRVDREAMQVAEARIARAEIVEGDLEA